MDAMSFKTYHGFTVVYFYLVFFPQHDIFLRHSCASLSSWDYRSLAIYLLINIPGSQRILPQAEFVSKGHVVDVKKMWRWSSALSIKGNVRPPWPTIDPWHSFHLSYGVAGGWLRNMQATDWSSYSLKHQLVVANKNWLSLFAMMRDSARLASSCKRCIRKTEGIGIWKSR